MSISFIIPCYNSAATLAEAVESVYESNFSAGDEVIIIDDASTDTSNEIADRLKNVYPGLNVLRHNTNRGSAAASRNSGIDVAKNELIFCLDSDNVLSKSSVLPLKDFLLSQHLDAAAFGEMRFFTKSIHNVEDIWTMHAQLEFIDALNSSHKTPCGSGNYLFTKSAWKKAGRYNESLGGALDSEIFGLCLLATGAKFSTLPGYGYFHRYGYDSTFIKEIHNYNDSLMIVAGIVKHLHLIHPKSVDYMLGSGRNNWRHNTIKRPIKGNFLAQESIFKIKVKRRIAGLLERM